MYYLIARFQDRESSDYVLARSYKKEDTEIKQLLIEWKKNGFTEKSGYKLYIKKV